MATATTTRIVSNGCSLRTCKRSLLDFLSTMLLLCVVTVAPAQAQSVQSQLTEESVSDDTTGPSTAATTPCTTGAGTPVPVRSNKLKSEVRYILDGKRLTENEFNAINLFNDSGSLAEAGRWSEATDKLLESVKLDPTSAQAQVNLGTCLLHIGKPEAACESLKTGLKLDPNLPEAWISLAGAYQSCGKLSEAISTYQQYLQKFPDDRFKANAKCILDSLQHEVDAQKQVEQRLQTSKQPESSRDSYLPYASPSGSIGWPMQKMPLKVFIGDGKAIPGFDQKYNQILKNSFIAWSNSVPGNKVSFVFVSDPKLADIDCNWTADLHKVSRLSEPGEVKLQYSSAGIKHADMALLARSSVDGTKFSENFARALCLHEVGHSLGLMGHSPEISDIMFCCIPFTDSLRELSGRDQATIKRLYAGIPRSAQKH